MTSSDPTWMSAGEIAEAIRTREISALEIADHFIARIEKYNPALNAVIFPRFDEARDAARRADGTPAGLPAGPLHGVPYLVKDIQQTVAGWPYAFGWKPLLDRGAIGEETGFVLQRMFDAGVNTLGSTTVPELGPSGHTISPAFGVTRNAWDRDRVAGGSTGGGGAAVAAGLVPWSHGADAGGSLRIPAALNGLVGLKASRGRSTLGPAHSDVWNHSCEEGVLARTVRDVALGLDTMRGPAPGDLYVAPEPLRPYVDEVGADPGRLRIGVLNESVMGLDLHDEAKAAVDVCGRLLADRGHTLDERWPSAIDDLDMQRHQLLIKAVFVADGVADAERRFGFTATGDDFGPWARYLWDLGRSISALDFVAFNGWRNRYTRAIATWFEETGNDLLLMPALLGPPPTIEEFEPQPDSDYKIMRDHMAYMATANFTGFPAMTVPVARTAGGLPMSAQLLAPYGREDVLFRVAAQLEESERWFERHPDLDG
ncbi:MAG: hypothetical protein ABS81_01455 [Pseudonocardia sp. SCN 72-86]|nr:MAG: hypothetical protein ABS81_01455 [Pseudonocardia sp. SCN 72-86]